MRRETQTRLRIALGILLTVVTLFFLYQVGDLVQILIIAALLSYILTPLARRLEAAGMGRTLAALTLMLVLVGILISLVILFVPEFVQQVQRLQADFNLERTQQLINEVEDSLVEQLSFFGIQKIGIMSALREAIRNEFEEYALYLSSFVNLVQHLVLIPVVMFFLIRDYRQIRRRAIELLPNRYFEFSLNLLHKIDLQLGNYLRSQLLDALIIGVLSAITLLILDVNFYIVIGMFAGFANLIPYVGPLVGAVTAILFDFITTGTFDKAVPIIIGFGIVQVIDNAVVYPLMVAQQVKMHPLVVLFSVLVGGKFFGMLGLLLAVPFTAMLIVVVRETVTTRRRYHFS